MPIEDSHVSPALLDEPTNGIAKEISAADTLQVMTECWANDLTLEQKGPPAPD
jgi:hypothetical protein